MEEDFWDNVLTAIDLSLIPDRIIEYFIGCGITTDVLIHSNISDRCIGKMSEYQETRIKLGSRMYEIDSYSDVDFANFICNHVEDYMPISILLEHRKSSNPMKKQIVEYAVSNNSINGDVVGYVQNCMRSEELRTTQDREKILAAYNEKNPILFVGISKNLFVDGNILEELSVIDSIKYAKYIRRNALKTIEIKRMLCSNNY